MKCELYQFYPEVYPFNLWIYVGKDVSGMVECFNNDFSYVDNSKAVTVSVPYGGCKLNPNTGFLIWFINKKIIDLIYEKCLCDGREGVPITNLPPPKRVFSPTPPSLENRKRVFTSNI